MTRALLTALVLLVVAHPSPAFAFLEFRQFGMAPVPAPTGDPMVEPDPPGGGGRYFTGSLSDGYTCAVCHFGGVAPQFPLEVEITPDPFADGYRAGTEYEIEVTLPYTLAGTDPDGVFAGNAELVDLEGRGAGTIAVEETPCPPPVVGMDPIAAHVVELENPTRQVAGMSACGPTTLRITWTAPDPSTGPVWLNVAAVSAAAGDNEPGDDVAETYARVIPPFGRAAEAGRVDSACSASPASPPRAPWLLALIALAAIRKLRTGTRP